jgi:hypothetical protein
MTGFATFAYSKKYFVSQEIEFIPESEIDPEFGESYKAPQDLINLLSDNIIVLDIGAFGNKVGIGTTDITAPRQELDVFGTAIVSERVGIATTQPREELDVIGTAIISESVGIGTTIPESGISGLNNATQGQLRLNVDGTISISRNIYDSAGSPGVNGAYLNRDAFGIRWVTFEPNFSEGIFIQDDGTYIPVVGAAQSFTVLNFKEINSLGIGTTTITPIPNPDNPTLIADIRTQDFWGYTAGGDIYRMTNVGIQNNNPSSTLDIAGTLHATGAVDFDSTLNVDGATTLQTTLNVKGATDLDTTLNVDGATTLQTTLNVKGATDLDTTLNVDGATVLQTTLNVKGATDLDTTLNVDGDTTLNATLDVDLTSRLGGLVTVDTGIVPDSDEGAYLGTSALPFSDAHIGEIRIADGANDNTIDTATGNLNLDSATNLVNVQANLDVDGTSVFDGTVELNSSLIDVNNSTATGKFDYRLSSVGTGVSWRPSGVETQNTIWVTKDGNDSNTGLLEGDAKATVGAAASVAEPGDTIVIRPGVYTENNPIGLRTDVTVTGQDLRLVTIRPLNVTKDVFHVRRGCLIENINFAGSSVSIAHTGCGAVAFPPTNPANYAVSGFIAPGPANEGSTGRWRSPYVRNCTNFMTGSIGMKINGDHATGSTLGNDLKSMVCDSFTQYNENGIGVSITNNAYAQLVSIFTINCDIGIYCDTGGSCDLTNSNSSFGNIGLKAVGIGSTEFTGTVGTYPPTRGQTGVDAGSDIVTFTNIGGSRRPYDGQTLFFKINLNNYPDTVGSGIIQAPMVDIQEVRVSYGGSDYSAASPPTVIIRDANDNSQQPKGPQGIIAELSPTVDPVTGAITAIDVVNSGRNYLSTQNLEVFIDGEPRPGKATAEVVTRPIYYAVDSATENSAGISTVTFTEFIPYALFGTEQVSFRRISRILTSSHSFEYIGSGIDINTATPFNGGVPIKANEVVALDGAQIPFTSTDQKGNFDIGEGFQINQPTSTIRGRDFSKAIQAEVTPLILALR